ncbi:hypothetical protein [Paenibacillus thalictri]|uniref:Uncharacterized protein n=1 Tax=Paenibacillus thalictri TaxID=2527873 RepID=A0A4Q9DH86_9BACL|nr:hypothetical protein [Paenibacillus thalictri]TBL70070.1 hypothetical protein EYB31_34225 [Paenibacillus thalictri]
MSTPVETSTVRQQPAARSVKSAKAKTSTYIYLLLGWILLIGAGVYGAKMYAEYMTKQIEQNIAAQTEQQLKTIQDDYQKQVTELKDNMTSDMAKMQSKIDSLSELLAFTKDSANSKTDNSNQLYTQLADVKKKLDDLKKSLDVLQ